MPKLLVIDATANAQGFEANFTTKLVDAIRRDSKWDVTVAGPVSGLADLARVDTSSADAVLLVAHGDGTAGGAQVAGIDVGPEDVHWYLAGSALDVHDKGLLLVVCEGVNRDAVDGVLREQFPRVIVGAPDGRTLLASDALAFFPAMLSYAREGSPSAMARAARQAASDTGVSVKVWEGL